MGETGICVLCQEERDLRKSHLIADSIYALIRKGLRPGQESKHAVLVTEEVSVLTDREMRTRLLCGSCEDRFSRDGERIVVGECLRGRDEFALLTELRAEQVVVNGRDDAWYAGSRLHSIDAQAYTYFAASFFWRASVGRWPGAEAQKWRGALGRKYEEMFRRYLLGDRPFPEQACLCVFVDTDPDPLPGASGPSASREHGYHIHKFYIPGVEFRLFLGNAVDRQIDWLFRRFDTRTFFILLNFRDQPAFPGIVDMVRGSTRRGKLAREKWEDGE